MDLSLSTKPDAAKAKTIVCALIAHAGGVFRGKTRLNKAFWWAHVYYYRHHKGLLSKYPIARLPEGPAIDDADDLLFALEREGRIRLKEEPVGDYIETIIELASDPPILDEDVDLVLAAACEWVRGKTGKTVSQESHKLSRGWKTMRNGDILDISSDALNENELASIEEDVKNIRHRGEWAMNLLDGVFAE